MAPTGSHSYRTEFFAAAAAATLLSVAGCVAGPPPIVIHEDPYQSIWVMYDPRSGEGHSHPVALDVSVLKTALKGMQYRGRDVVGGFGFFADHEGSPVFTQQQTEILAPRISSALAKASPRDLVTFYLVGGDPTLGKVVTSGGMFVRNDWLFIILANVRTSPSSVQYENTYEIDTRDQPLLPLARYKFAVTFNPPDALVLNDQALARTGYDVNDRAKLAVIDLTRLATAGQPSGESSIPHSP
jgi:hypothetical protein